MDDVQFEMWKQRHKWAMRQFEPLNALIAEWERAEKERENSDIAHDFAHEWSIEEERRNDGTHAASGDW